MLVAVSDSATVNAACPHCPFMRPATAWLNNHNPELEWDCLEPLETAFVPTPASTESAPADTVPERVLRPYPPWYFGLAELCQGGKTPTTAMSTPDKMKRASYP